MEPYEPQVYQEPTDYRELPPINSEPIIENVRPVAPKAETSKPEVKKQETPKTTPEQKPKTVEPKPKPTVSAPVAPKTTPAKTEVKPKVRKVVVE